MARSKVLLFFAFFLISAFLVCERGPFGSCADAKELEGFGDELEEEFVEDDDPSLPEYSVPLKPPGARDAPGPPLEDPIAISVDDDPETEDDYSRDVTLPPAGGSGKPVRDEEKQSDAEQSGAGVKGLSSFSKSGDGKQQSDRRTKQRATAVADWDEDEFEGVPAVHQQGAPPPSSASKRPPSGKASAVPIPDKPKKAFHPLDYVPEMCFVVFLIIYAINYYVGSKANESIALAWADEFAQTENSLFAKNFSLLGTGESNDANEPLMIKEGQNVFKFYASGRRFCECAFVTLDLRHRHDLLSMMWYILFPRPDEMYIDVPMNDDAMDPFIFAVVPRKSVKAFTKEHKDVKEYCNLVDLSARRRWTADGLAVITDCKEAASELLSDVILDQLFGEKVYEKYAAEYFLALHFTDQAPKAVKKKILHFRFLLPPIKSIAAVTRLTAAVPYYIDVVGRLTLSSAAKAKAEERRAQVNAAQLKEEQEQRMEEMQRRREEKKKAEEAKLSPAELARRREKERLKEMRPRSRLTKIH